MDKNIERFKVDIEKVSLVEIEIFSYCNRQCWFCPNSFIDRHSTNILMDENLYLKILSELKAINYSGTISYSRYNEPTSHKEIFLERLRQAREYLPNARLHTNTNGDYITKEYIDELCSAGLNSLFIQCYLKKDEIFDNQKLKERIIKKANDLGLEYNFIKDIHDRVDAKFEHKDMLIRMYARDFKVNGNFRAGTLDTIKPQKRNRPCYTIFREIYIDHNGSVMPCCNFRSDIKEHEKFILGNVKDNNVFDIFNGETNLKLRSILCNNEFDLYPCCECTFT